MSDKNGKHALADTNTHIVFHILYEKYVLSLDKRPVTLYAQITASHILAK